MSQTEKKLERVLPFSVKVVSIVDGMVYVLLPQSIQTKNDNEVIIHDDIRIVVVDPGSNRSHNIMRDVRKTIRKLNLLVSSKEQGDLITILN